VSEQEAKAECNDMQRETWESAFTATAVTPAARPGVNQP